jgi:ankyrin repeat protein
LIIVSNGIIEAIHTGDVAALNQIVSADPALVHAKLDGQRTLLHIATDWPGHFPHVQETISALIAHGADVNARFAGFHSERPLHWAASSDDLNALNALLDHGADIEATGSVIDGGTPLADAVAFRQWLAARRLIERGARTTISQAAALGLMDRVETYFAADPPPSPEIVTIAFWNACHGGQLQAARYLLARGADLNWSGHGGLTPLDTAARYGNAELMDWLRGQGAVFSVQSA